MIDSLLDQMQPGASDDEDEEQLEVKFAISGSEAGALRPVDCRTLVLCGPGVASAFALGGLALQPLPWQMQPVGDSKAAFPPAPKTPKFFVVPGTTDADAVVVALLDSQVPSDYALSFSDALLEAFTGVSQVILLDRILRAEWGCGAGGRPEEPHVAGLWTSSWGSTGPAKLAMPRLPAPNYLEGLGAALLTRCEASRQRCLVALALQDGAHLSEGCIRSFEALVPLLLDLKVVPPSWKTPNYMEAARKVVAPSSMSIYA
ncbi:unnamed protein product [Polarella glacialis]|uniref:Proteasome assembly chaperone 1 n=1 Tax=Polarella glacialis TaxID=89957 RepID=A0A813JPU8_POLGL|nr:unnamed protein product [Polarella glacialis]CAE8680198.1 unnamed protein product [Polarella glacialis]|mmetsp:Transcript_71443/g.115273  ORF Transcript_71443/g.115273 Transcript_71443/m.115273 type:complete len:260 (-) Transcript_71443:70-849(-)